jgi:hypothetical protein
LSIAAPAAELGTLPDIEASAASAGDGAATAWLCVIVSVANRQVAATKSLAMRMRGAVLMPS